MSLEMAARVETILDPRGVRVEPPTPLAPRRDSLAASRLLILDNEKLVGRPNYEPLVPTLAGGLTGLAGAAECLVWQRAIMGLQPEALAQLMVEIESAEPGGVIVLLGDAGSVRETLMFSIRLEGHGIPTVTLVTPGAALLAATMAQSYCPGLPLVQVDVSYVDAPERVADQIERAVPEVVRALSRDGAVSRTSAPDPRVAVLAPVAPGAVLDLGAAPDVDEVYEALDRVRATDGLPVIPPTAERVERMLAATHRARNEVLRAETAPSGTVLTIEKVAINAVMAGCQPDYFPIVLAAVEAVCQPEYFLDTGAITTHSAGNAVIVSGPLAGRVGMNAGGGCLGPGNRANATIGRTLALVVLNVLRAVPGLSDMASIGSPGEYIYCLAENDADSPWPGLHTELYGPDVTSVTVVKAESPHNFLDEYSLRAEHLLDLPVAALSTIAHNNAYRPGNVLLILNPLHARVIADSGWTKNDVRTYVHERARVPLAATRGHGTIPSRPAWMSGLESVPVTRSPEDVIVVVAGARGPQSLVAPTWGFSYAVNRPVHAVAAA
jgi:hypothetical protein